MKKSLGVLSAVMALSFVGAPAAQAFTLSIVPQTSTVTLGQSISFDVVASVLADNAAPSLATYDIDFKFNGSMLALTGTTFGTGLSLNGEASFHEPTPSPGSVNLFELSFNTSADLNSLQADTFTLFTLTFDTIGAGTSALELFANVLGDADGGALSADVTNASVSVSAVPLPGAAFLLLSGLGARSAAFAVRVAPGAFERQAPRPRRDELMDGVRAP